MRRVIIWLNGTFGAGKTTTAAELLGQLPGSRAFDPETVGYMLRANLADHPVADFQDWPPWRTLVVATAAELASHTGQVLIAPQTVLVRQYLAEITAGLTARGLPVFHVLLDCSEDVLRRRIENSDEARQWRLNHLADYRRARGWLIEAADLVVDTAALSPAQVAETIRASLPIPCPAADGRRDPCAVLSHHHQGRTG
jgi:chloramphenicol 3-O-phosphotransferase